MVYVIFSKGVFQENVLHSIIYKISPDILNASHVSWFILYDKFEFPNDPEKESDYKPPTAESRKLEPDICIIKHNNSSLVHAKKKCALF